MLGIYALCESGGTVSRCCWIAVGFFRGSSEPGPCSMDFEGSVAAFVDEDQEVLERTTIMTHDL